MPSLDQGQHREGINRASRSESRRKACALEDVRSQQYSQQLRQRTNAVTPDTIHARDYAAHTCCGCAQTGEAPFILPTPPKRKRKRPSRPGDDDDDGAVNGILKKRKTGGDGAKPRKVSPTASLHFLPSPKCVRVSMQPECRCNDLENS